MEEPEDDLTTGEIRIEKVKDLAEGKALARQGLLTEIADGVVELSNRTRNLTQEIQNLAKRGMLRGRVLLGFILITVLIFVAAGGLWYQENRRQVQTRQEVCGAFDSVETALVDLILFRNGHAVSPEERTEREKFADQIRQRFRENDPCG